MSLSVLFSFFASILNQPANKTKVTWAAHQCYMVSQIRTHKKSQKYKYRYATSRLQQIKEIRNDAHHKLKVFFIKASITFEQRIFPLHYYRNASSFSIFPRKNKSEGIKKFG